MKKKLKLFFKQKKSKRKKEASKENKSGYSQERLESKAKKQLKKQLTNQGGEMQGSTEPKKCR